MTLFAITNYHWPICWMICFIHFVRLSFPCWLWRLVIPYTYFRLRAHGGCDRSAEDACSFAAPGPTFAFVGGPYCPTLDFVITFWIMITFYTLLTLLFCIISLIIKKLFILRQEGISKCSLKVSQCLKFSHQKAPMRVWDGTLGRKWYEWRRNSYTKTGTV
jgi:hypothetical protein